VNKPWIPSVMQPYQSSFVRFHFALFNAYALSYPLALQYVGQLDGHSHDNSINWAGSGVNDGRPRVSLGLQGDIDWGKHVGQRRTGKMSCLKSSQYGRHDRCKRVHQRTCHP
jgi:hypothetical protein